MDTGELVIDCDVCGAQNTVYPILAKNWLLQGCPVLFCECSECGCEYGNAKITTVNKIMSIQWRER